MLSRWYPMFAGGDDNNKEKEVKQEKKIGYSGIVSLVHSIRWSLSSIGKKPLKKTIAIEKNEDVKEIAAVGDDVSSVYTDDNDSNQSLASTLCADDKYINDCLKSESLSPRSTISFEDDQTSFKDINLNEKLSYKSDHGILKVSKSENADNGNLKVPQLKLSRLKIKDCDQDLILSPESDLDTSRSSRSTFSVGSPTSRSTSSTLSPTSRSYFSVGSPTSRSTSSTLSPTSRNTLSPTSRNTFSPTSPTHSGGFTRAMGGCS